LNSPRAENPTLIKLNVVSADTGSSWCLVADQVTPSRCPVTPDPGPRTPRRLRRSGHSALPHRRPAQSHRLMQLLLIDLLALFDLHGRAQAFVRLPGAPAAWDSSASWGSTAAWSSYGARHRPSGRSRFGAVRGERVPLGLLQRELASRDGRY
jgi:hypothetical protein